MIVLSLIVAALATARLTRLLTEDKIMSWWRRWVVNKFGESSLPSYLVHCPWCMSLWVAVPVMLVAALFPYPWVVGILAVPAASMVTGLLLDRE